MTDEEKVLLSVLKEWVYEVARRNQAQFWSPLMTKTINEVRKYEPEFWGGTRK
jgi:hypothetical protein